MIKNFGHCQHSSVQQEKSNRNTKLRASSGTFNKGIQIELRLFSSAFLFALFREKGTLPVYFSLNYFSRFVHLILDDIYCHRKVMKIAFVFSEEFNAGIRNLFQFDDA